MTETMQRMPTTHPLMQRLRAALKARQIDLDEATAADIEREFYGRLGRRDPYVPEEDVIDTWSKHLGDYVGLLDTLAREQRKARGVPDRVPIVLDPEIVRRSFVTCSQICPGPS